MVWLGMILTMILAQLVQWWSEWGFRFTVLASLGANLVVGILSGTRRRSATGGLWGWLGQLAKFFLWLGYQVAEAATTNAIGSLSLCGSDASEEEKQVVAFWACFLLLHLGGPDNLTAYSLEDNKTSGRKWLVIITRILGVAYTIYDNTHPGGRSWALLLAASVVMFVAGAVRYFETGIALGKADLESMQEDASSSSTKDDDVHQMNLLKSKIKRTKRQERWLRDGKALLLAQDLFPIWRHALVDSSVDPDSERQKASELIILELNWESMCKVAEMELSLIYEFLYTKAILARTWCYYLIRLLSPLFTAAAAFLFCFWIQQQQGVTVRGSFVGITYALLAITFLMDVAWLLRALGSTWGYAYLREHRRQAWLHHQAFLHRIVVRLDPLRLFCRDPVSHRRWSGTIGRYNLLDECTATATTTCPCPCPCPCPDWWPWSMAGDDKPKEMRYLCKLPQCVKELLFERVTQVLLKQAIEKEGDEEKKKKKKKKYTRLDIRTQWGHKAFSRAVKEHKINPPPQSSELDEDSIFGKEFEEDVLLWHIATCMLLPHRQEGKYARAIEVLSEYMMFLVAVRRQMLPGLVLHSQLQITRKTLVHKIWAEAQGNKWFRTLIKESRMSNKEKLAMILRHVITKKEDTEIQQADVIIKGTEGTQLLAHAVALYFYLSGEEPSAYAESRAAWGPGPLVPDGMLEFIFNVWVDKLVYAAVRCSREAHARQLSAGGELTTVLWMLIQHAGPFCMGEAPDIIIRLPKVGALEEKPVPAPARPPKKEPAPPPPEKKDEPWPSPPPELPPPTVAGIPPPPPYYPMYPPYYGPPVCPPYYGPSWPPVCPWYPQCPPQHEKPGDETEGASREDENEDSSSDEDSEE